MELRGLLLLGVLLGAEAAQVVQRQLTIITSTTDLIQFTSTAILEVTTVPDSTASTTSVDTSSSDDDTTSSTAEGDTTVTRTTTITDDNIGTVSQKTTVLTTITSTIVVTATEFETTTVTSRDADTATKTVYETSTQFANQRRAIDLAPRTVGLEYLEVDARATAVPTVTQIYWEELELVRHKRGDLHKRDTITEFVTVTVGTDSEATVVDTVTRTVISSVDKKTTTTSTITETEQADASTTITTTSTLIVTSTAVTTGVVRTQTLAPTATGVTGNDDNGSSSGSSGLSTGAKAGIGAGCGAVGLAVLAGLLWFCLKRRRSGPKHDADDMFGSSEVPVARSGADTQTPMSQQNRDTAANIITPRRIPTKASSPEGYRGTAPGDGRAGFAKPKPFGSAYTNVVNPVSPETQYSRTTDHTDPASDAVELQSPANTAELGNDGNTGRWHESNAAEIDGNQVGPHGTDPVYEMPAQHYK